MIISNFVILTKHIVPPQLSCDGPKSRTLDVRTELTLRCTYNGSPIPIFTWELNNSLVDSTNPNITLYAVTGVNLRSTIFRWMYLTPNSRGIYTITVSNEIGTVMSQFDISIASRL